MIWLRQKMNIHQVSRISRNSLTCLLALEAFKWRAAQDQFVSSFISKRISKSSFWPSSSSELHPMEADSTGIRRKTPSLLWDEDKNLPLWEGLESVTLRLQAKLGEHCRGTFEQGIEPPNAQSATRETSILSSPFCRPLFFSCFVLGLWAAKPVRKLPAVVWFGSRCETFDFSQHTAFVRREKPIDYLL